MLVLVLVMSVQPQPQPQPQLSVEGHACSLVSRAEEEEEGQRLQLWAGERQRDLWIDAHDVRALCSQYSELRGGGGGGGGREGGQGRSSDLEPGSDEDCDYEQLVYERYQDMLDVKECDVAALGPPFQQHSTEELTVGPDEAPGHSADTPTAYSYTQYTTDSVSSDPFVKPSYSFPSNIKHFPDSMKQYNIILHTAHAVRGNRQLEILLKVKQKMNPKFYFLEEDINSRCDLYPLYVHLRDLDDKTFWMLLLGKCSADEELNSDNNDGNALALLGAYSDSGSDSDCDSDSDYESKSSSMKGRSTSRDSTLGSPTNLSEASTMSVNKDTPDDNSTAIVTDNIINADRVEGNDEVDSFREDDYSSSSDMLDSDVDEDMQRFWTRRSRKTKARKRLQDAIDRRQERLLKAKMLSDYFLTAASSSSTDCKNTDDTAVDCQKIKFYDSEMSSSASPPQRHKRDMTGRYIQHDRKTDMPRSRSRTRTRPRSRSRSRSRSRLKTIDGTSKRLRQCYGANDASEDRYDIKSNCSSESGDNWASTRHSSKQPDITIDRAAVRSKIHAMLHT